MKKGAWPPCLAAQRVSPATLPPLPPHRVTLGTSPGSAKPRGSIFSYQADREKGHSPGDPAWPTVGKGYLSSFPLSFVIALRFQKGLEIK